MPRRRPRPTNTCAGCGVSENVSIFYPPDADGKPPATGIPVCETCAKSAAGRIHQYGTGKLAPEKTRQWRAETHQKRRAARGPGRPKDTDPRVGLLCNGRYPALSLNHAAFVALGSPERLQATLAGGRLVLRRARKRDVTAPRGQAPRRLGHVRFNVPDLARELVRYHLPARFPHINVRRGRGELVVEIPTA